MDNTYFKSVVEMPFGRVVELLNEELHRSGFVVCGGADYSHGDSGEAGKWNYLVVSAYVPHLYREMLSSLPFEGLLLPCSISLIEAHPGRTTVVALNPSESILKEIADPGLQNLAAEVTRRLNKTVSDFTRKKTGAPDIVTSW